MRVFKKVKQYALICCVVHAEEVAYCDTFYNLKNAKKKLNEFAKYNYECEKECVDDGYDVYFELKDKYARLERESPDGTWIWTWKIIKCNEPSWTYWDALCESLYNFIDKFKNKLLRGRLYARRFYDGLYSCPKTKL